MKSKSTVWIIIIVALVVLGFYFSSREPEQIDSNQEDSMMTEDQTEDSNMMTEDEMIKADENLGDVLPEENMEASISGYEVYDVAKLANAKSGKVVLFFRATWCPTCRALDKDIRANLEQIPEGTLILDVDYDKYNDLKKKYGVTYQHTLVQVDEDGASIKKWSGSSTLSELVKESI